MPQTRVKTWLKAESSTSCPLCSQATQIWYSYPFLYSRPKELAGDTFASTSSYKQLFSSPQIKIQLQAQCEIKTEIKPQTLGWAQAGRDDAEKLLIVTSRKEIHSKKLTVEKLMCGKRTGGDCSRPREEHE